MGIFYVMIGIVRIDLRVWLRSAGGVHGVVLGFGGLVWGVG